jgi:hypothetical protein
MGRRGGDKLFQKNKQKKKDLERKIEYKKARAKVIIACEDSISAPAYFRMIIDKLIKEKNISPNSIVIVPHDGKTHPTGVLDNLINYEVDGLNYIDFDEKWIVIDRDANYNGGGHTAEDFNKAFKKAKKFKVKVAYANDSFELWYLLHFEYRDTAIMRDEIIKKVISYLKNKDENIFLFLDEDNFKTEKYNKQIFKILEDLQSNAITNSKELLKSYNPHNPEKDNPSTNIYKLVEILNNQKDSK